MKVEFTNRAVDDLRNISAYSRKEFGVHIAAALEFRIRNGAGNRPSAAGAAGYTRCAAGTISIQGLL